MEFLQRLFIDPFNRFLDNLLFFLPNFLTALVILLVGLLLGALLKMAVVRLLRAVGIDGLCERTGMSQMLCKSGIRDPLSLLLAKIAGGVTVAVFAVIAVQTISVPAVERLLERFFLYLPNVFVAMIILFVGYLLSNFLARAALIASVNAGVRLSGLVGRFVRYVILIMSITMALEHLGIGSETVIIAFTIVFSGVVLAFALAFGLGGRDAARDYLERKLKGVEREEDDLTHL
ncbi:MAG: hypothetical protein EG822_16100 [Deltaproteobacteria bacterium]|nr:hypothetical protein [Deltaproteobacteria bacterium]TLN02353.1 MAG: hypothetical protein FDZ73_12085 [bacterium]